MAEQKFAGKHVVVTGGANGIGRCIVELFRRQGAAVAVIDLDENQPVECELYQQGDIAEEVVLRAFAARVIKRFGEVDILVNNACLSKGGIFDCSYEEFLYVHRVGVAAPYLLTQLLLPHFRQGGAVLQIASTRAEQSQPNTESYTAAKGGIAALTHALAVSLAGKVRVNCISPGWIDTKESALSQEDAAQHPAGRVGVPADIAELALFLCSEQAGFLTGENITVDGGMSRLMIYHGDHGWKYEG